MKMTKHTAQMDVFTGHIIPTKEVTAIYPECRPTVGRIYPAEICFGMGPYFCVIPVADKRIILRRGEFRIVEDGEIPEGAGHAGD